MPVLGVNHWDGALRGLGSLMAHDVWLQSLSCSGDLTTSCLGDWERAIRLAAASDASSCCSSLDAFACGSSLLRL